MVTTIDLLTGILTLTPLILGYIMGTITLRIYLKGGSNLVLLTSILFYALPSPWLGVSITFIEQMLGVGMLDSTTYVFIYAWSPPLIAAIWNYTSASLLKFNDYFKYLVLLLIGILDAVFLWSIYVNREFEVNRVPDSIFLDSTFTGMASLTATLIVLTIVIFVVPLYFWISFKTEDKLFKFKARMIGLGSLFFAVSAGLDATVPISNIMLILIVRLALVTSLLLLFVGYNTPERIRARYT